MQWTIQPKFSSSSGSISMVLSDITTSGCLWKRVLLMYWQCQIITQIPFGSSRLYTTRHVRHVEPMHLAVSTLSNSTARYAGLDALDTSNVSCRVETWRDESSEMWVYISFDVHCSEICWKLQERVYLPIYLFVLGVFFIDVVRKSGKTSWDSRNVLRNVSWEIFQAKKLREIFTTVGAGGRCSLSTRRRCGRTRAYELVSTAPTSTSWSTAPNSEYRVPTFAPPPPSPQFKYTGWPKIHYQISNKSH